MQQGQEEAPRSEAASAAAIRAAEELQAAEEHQDTPIMEGLQDSEVDSQHQEEDSQLAEGCSEDTHPLAAIRAIVIMWTT